MLPELLAGERSVRVPELRNVALTDRVVDIIDHPAFQRLRTVRQLGPTHLVYPGAVHTRFEHSLGVFDMARQYIEALLRHPHVAASLTEHDILVCLLGALLHDLGHYPFAHSLEALHHAGMDTPRHEDLTGRILLGEVDALRGETPIGTIIANRFGIDPQEVVDFVTRKPRWHARPERRLVATILSSGVDADKADYLERDSIHMGVTYGRNYDRARFLGALRPSVDGDAIAVSDKGRVASEIFIFCRYTMFSEAYWHHTVRAVSAMVERALGDFQARAQLDLPTLTRELLSRPDDDLLRWLVDQSPSDSQAHKLIGAMTGGRRRFYKRVLALNRVFDDIRHHNAYERVYHLDRDAVVALREELAATISRAVGCRATLNDVIIDTPPRDKDRVESVKVVYADGGTETERRLDEVSKVVQGIGTDFMKVVKKIRIFVSPEVRDAIDAAGGRARIVGELFRTILDFSPERDMQQQLFASPSHGRPS